MTRLFLTLATTAFTLPAVAEEYIAANWQCSFTTECVETEACADTSYDLEVSYDISQLKDKPGEGAGSGQIIDQTATRKAVILHDNGAFFATAFDFEQEATITSERFELFATKEGEARLISALTEVPMLITYHGHCVEAGS